MITGAGDELQGIKRGIMEMADLIAITKADGNNIERAKITKSELMNALHLFPLRQSKWVPKVFTISSLEQSGIEAVWNSITEYQQFTTQNEYFSRKRNEQSKFWMYETINESLKNNFYKREGISEKLRTLEQDIIQNKMSSFSAANALLNQYFKHKND
jgi:LAO/AO transport system kinase